MVSLTFGNMNSWLRGPYAFSRPPLSFCTWEFYNSRNVSIACFIEKDTIAHQCGCVAYKPTNCAHRLLGKSEITDCSQAQNKHVEHEAFRMILKPYFLKWAGRPGVWTGTEYRNFQLTFQVLTATEYRNVQLIFQVLTCTEYRNVQLTFQVLTGTEHWNVQLTFQ